MLSRHLLFALLFALSSSISTLKAMEAWLLDEESETPSNHNQASLHDDTVITLELKDENNHTLFSILLPYKAVKLATTLDHPIDVDEENTIIPIAIDQINDIEIGAFKYALQLLDMQGPFFLALWKTKISYITFLIH